MLRKNPTTKRKFTIILLRILLEIIGYTLALFIGLSLGLVGSGGTILAVPILVYLFHITNMQEATHYSMFIVGTTAFIGAYKKYQEQLVDLNTALYFSIPSLISLFLTRKIILPLIPNELFQFENFHFTKDIFLLILFAVVMLFASFSMFKSAQQQDVDCFAKTPTNDNHFKTSVAAVFVGMLTGLLGAGGGFLIVPVLILLKNHCMKRATGTSLIIITANSLFGFIGDLHTQINWHIVLLFSTIAIFGMLIGIRLSEKIEGDILKKMFSIMVLAIGIYIIVKEIFL
ncbi:MAG: sulfite exporter TauE/SafE family protein [Chitinophagales bacterium]